MSNQGSKNSNDSSQETMNSNDVNQSDSDESDCEQSSSVEESSDDDLSQIGKPKVENPGLHCATCKLTCCSPITFQNHMRGAKHLKNTRAAEFSLFRGLYTFKELNRSGMTLKDYMDDPLREPLIGLEHMTEYTVARKRQKTYRCELCDFQSQLAPMIQHLNGFKHRKEYIRIEFPFLLKTPKGGKEDKAQFLKRMAADIERDEGLKMYKMISVSKQTKIKSGLDLQAGDVHINKRRCDVGVTEKDKAKKKALLHLKTFKISSHSEAALVMAMKKKLTASANAYCLRIKEQKELAERQARKKIMELEKQAPFKECFGKLSGIGKKSHNPTKKGKKAGKVLKVMDPLSKPFVFGIEKWEQNQLLLKNEARRYDPMKKVGKGVKAIIPESIPFSFASENWKPNTLLPKNEDESADPMENLGKGLKAINPESIPFFFGMPSSPIHEPPSSGEYLAGTTGNFSAELNMFPGNIDSQERVGNLEFSQSLTPNTHINGHPVLFGTSEMELPRTVSPTHFGTMASPLTAEILSKIHGKDATSAAFILTSLCASNPALQTSENWKPNTLLPKNEDESADPMENLGKGLKAINPESIPFYFGMPSSPIHEPPSSGEYLAGTTGNFSAELNMFPGNIDSQERVGNVEFSQSLPPNTHINAHPVLFGTSEMELPRTVSPTNFGTMASPLTAEILSKIHGKDATSAAFILTSLCASNPALQKVNVAELLDLLIRTGTIK